MTLVYQYMAIFFTFPTTSNHLHPLQVKNCDSNLRLVVDEDDNGKLPAKWRHLNFRPLEVVSRWRDSQFLKWVKNIQIRQNKGERLINIAD